MWFRFRFKIHFITAVVLCLGGGIVFERQFNKCSPVATTSSPSTLRLAPRFSRAVTVQTLQLCGELQVTAQPPVYLGKYRLSSSEGSKFRFSSSEGSPARVKAVCEDFPVPGLAVRGDVPVQRLELVEICKELPVCGRAVRGEVPVQRLQLVEACKESPGHSQAVRGVVPVQRLGLGEVCKEFPVHGQVVRRGVLSVGAGPELVESSFFSSKEELENSFFSLREELESWFFSLREELDCQLVRRGVHSVVVLHQGVLWGEGVRRGVFLVPEVHQGVFWGKGVRRGLFLVPDLHQGVLWEEGVRQGVLSVQGISRGVFSVEKVRQSVLSVEGISRGVLSVGEVRRSVLSVEGISRGVLLVGELSRGVLSVQEHRPQSCSVRMTRTAKADLAKSHDAFMLALKLCQDAFDRKKVNKYRKELDNLEAAFFKMHGNHAVYRRYVIEQQGITQDAFNRVTDRDGVTTPDHPTNDAWAEEQFQSFVKIRDMLEEVLDKDEGPVAGPSGSCKEEEKYVVSGVDVNMVVEDLKATMSIIKANIMELSSEIDAIDDQELTSNVMGAYESIIHKHQLKIETETKDKVNRLVSMSTMPQDPMYAPDKVLSIYTGFAEEQSSMLNKCTLTLIKKVKPEEYKPPTATSSKDNDKPKEQVFLEKTKPPKFNGDVLEFAEFKRKWMAQVNKANLPEESELDKLRDNIPKEAKDQLYAIEKLDEAWRILTERYGDELVIAKKLKGQLKNIQSSGKSDPEKIVSLKIKVRNLVSRLQTLKMDQTLKHDTEFLSAVFGELPDKHRQEWLKQSECDDKWDNMLQYLDKAYDRARKEIALLSVVDEKPTKRDVRAAGLNAGLPKLPKNKIDPNAAVDGWIDGAAKYKRLKESVGKCKICDQFHTWKSRQNIVWPSDRFMNCRQFKDMTVQQRAEAVERVQGCARCTAWGHQRKDCRMRPNSCGEMVSGAKCTGDHSKMLHGSGNVYCAALSAGGVGQMSDVFACVKEDEDTVYYLQDIPVAKSKVMARTLWDRGSNRVLIREDFAKEQNLMSKPVTYQMETVGDQPVSQHHGHVYLLDLVDIYGNVKNVWGYGIPRIMLSEVPDLMPVRKLFPHLPSEAFRALQTKEVDVLIGLNQNELQPSGGTGIDKVGGLSALRSMFGTGWVIGGHHEDIKCGMSPRMSTSAVTLKIAKILVKPEPHLTPEFWEAEGMGVLPPPRCDSCKGCMSSGPCSEKQYMYGVKKQAELELIQSKTKLVDGEVWCEYPFIRDPACLGNNRNAAVKVAERVEKGVMKDGLHEAYNEQIKSFLERGVAVRLSVDEMESWSGPCQYITHHAVLKDSVTTPVRIVTNSSVNNGGKSLNSCLATGPNSLNPMLDVMLRFRCYETALQLDLAKAYNTLRTGLVERHLRRFVWRFDPAEPWQDFALDRVHFGDASASTQLEVGKNLIADAGAYIDKEAAEKLKNDLYVDDGLTGGTKEQVQRFVGNKHPDTGYDGTMCQILAKGNFKVKAFGISGQEPNEESELLGNKVLGYGYNIKEDMLEVNFPVNLSRKKRSVRTQPNLTLKDIGGLRSRSMTKRILLGVTNGFGDFLGIATPFTIKFKIMMRELFMLEDALTWDEEPPDWVKEAFVALITEALRGESLMFPRSTRPVNAKPGVGPVVVGFSDHGQYAYEARVYLRWELEEGSDDEYAARLAICKAKVPPLTGITVPRGELNALTLQSRLVLRVVSALQRLDHPPVSSVLCSDSKCAISATRSTRSLLPYFQNRVAEVKDNMEQTRRYCPVEEIQYVESALNPSDMSTKAAMNLDELGPDSFHQLGPNFLRLPRGQWDVSCDFVPEEIPADEYRVRDKLVFSAAMRANFCHSSTYPSNPWKVVEELLHYSDSLRKVVRIVARYLRGLESGLRKNVNMTIENPVAYTIVAADPKKYELETAERLLLLHGMVFTQEAWVAGKLTSLLPSKQGKIIVTRGRLGEKSLERILGVTALPILMPKSRIAYLYMVYAHCGEFGLVHRGAVSTLARSRRYVWIVKGKDLARRVVKACAKCSLAKKELLQQQMSLIKDEQLQVAPPWTHIALDFAGPIKVKGEVNKRATLKVWILIYSCRATKAVCMLACPGYSTADFLCKHEEFVCRKGRPSSIVSDRGSQLVAAGVEVANKELPLAKVDWEEVVRKNCATNWTFVPIGAQHRNGISEATVKVMKKSLALALNPGADLTYAELVTLLSRITHSINSRPLALAQTSPRSQQEDDMMPITPNHLLLGRATIEVPDMDYDPTSKFSARLAYVEQVYKAWWSKWIQDVLPTLVPCKRWKHIQKNVKVGDVVMMKYASSIKDGYRLARVLEVYPDAKGLVRTVKIGYRRRDKREAPDVYWKKPLVEEKVAVQRLAMLQAVNEPPIASSEEYAGAVASSEEYAGVEVSQGPDCMQVGAGADSGSASKFAEKKSQLEADAGSPATNVEGVAGSPATNQEPTQFDDDAGSPATELVAKAGSPATNQGSGNCVVPSLVSEPANEVFEGVAAGSPATNERPASLDQSPKEVFGQMPKSKPAEVFVQKPREVFEHMPRPTSCMGDLLRGGRSEKH